jgi:hypothetical protein
MKNHLLLLIFNYIFIPMKRTSIVSYLCIATVLFVNTPVFAGNFQDPLEESITIEGTANDGIDIERRFQDWAIDI